MVVGIPYLPLGTEDVNERTSSRDVRTSGMNLTGMKETAPLSDGSGEFMQKCVRLMPVDASVGDALSIDKRLAVYESLRSSNEIAFNHGTHDSAFPVHNLFCHGAAY